MTTSTVSSLATLRHHICRIFLGLSSSLAISWPRKLCVLSLTDILLITSSEASSVAFAFTLALPNLVFTAKMRYLHRTKRPRSYCLHSELPNITMAEKILGSQVLSQGYGILDWPGALKGAISKKPFSSSILQRPYGDLPRACHGLFT